MQPFWRRPKWIAGHALALVTVVTFVALGFWQLDRLDQRRAHNALASERAGAEPAAIGDVLSSPPGDAAFRPAVATGTYEPAGEVLLSMRSRDGRAGHHVLTPLRTTAGSLVIVDRGWVPMEWDDPPVPAAPPPGVVEVAGIVHPGQDARRAGRFDGGDGPLQFVSHVDLERIGDALGEPVAPLYLVASPGQAPAGEAYPLPVEPAPLEEGNHLSYAVQWFLFAGVVAAGYPVLLRRTGRDSRGGSTGAERPTAAVPG